MTIESKDKKIHSKVVNALDIVGSDFRAYKNGYSGEYNVNKNVVDTLSGSLLQYIQEIRANLREYE